MLAAFGFAALTSGIHAASTALADEFLNKGGSAQAFLNSKGFGKRTRAGTLVNVSSVAMLKDLMNGLNAKLAAASDPADVERLSRLANEVAAIAKKDVPNASWAAIAPTRAAIAQLEGAVNIGDQAAIDKADNVALGRIQGVVNTGAAQVKDVAADTVVQQDKVEQFTAKKKAVKEARAKLAGLVAERCKSKANWDAYNKLDRELQQLVVERTDLSNEIQGNVSKDIAVTTETIAKVEATANEAQKAPEGTGVWNWVKNTGWAAKAAVAGLFFTAGSAAVNKVSGYGYSLTDITSKISSAAYFMTIAMPDSNYAKVATVIGRICAAVGIAKVAYDTIYPGKEVIDAAVEGENGKTLEVATQSVGADNPAMKKAAENLKKAADELAALMVNRGVLKTNIEKLMQSPELKEENGAFANGEGNEGLDKLNGFCDGLQDVEAKIAIAQDALIEQQNLFNTAIKVLVKTVAATAAISAGAATAAYAYARYIGMDHAQATAFVKAGAGAVLAIPGAKLSKAASWVSGYIWKTPVKEKGFLERALTYPLYEYGKPLGEKPGVVAIKKALSGNWDFSAGANF